jgi:hypothetical protein
MINTERFKQRLREEFEGQYDFYGLAKKWRDEGVSQLELYLLFHDFLLSVNDEDSPRVDAIADALDGIASGWGNRRYYLFDSDLSNQPIFAEQQKRLQDRIDALRREPPESDESSSESNG